METTYFNSSPSTSTPFREVKSLSDTGYESLSHVFHEPCVNASGGSSSIEFETLPSFSNQSLKRFNPPGRFFGRRYLDIIGELWNYDKSGMLVETIFKFLDFDDLHRIKRVGKLWKEICSNCKQHISKRQPVNIPSPENKENCLLLSKPIQNQPGVRGILSIRQTGSGNVSVNIESKPFCLPSNVTEWWNVARQCVGREHLRKCPVCSGPSIRREGTWPDQLVCQQNFCAAIVCAACLFPHNPSIACPSPLLRSPLTGRVGISSETIQHSGRREQSTVQSHSAKKNRALLKRL